MTKYNPDPKRYDGRMKYRRCGRSGLLLPAISLGCWKNFGGDSPTTIQRQMIHTAFDCGITHFDLANNYGPPYGSAERNVGAILADMPRDELVISSKAGYDMWPGPYGEWGSRKYMLTSLEHSLKRLRLDYVDIFYSHRFDPDTPLEETLGALNSAVQQGKALYVGISSYNSEQTNESARICRENGYAKITIHQPNYSMLNRWIEKQLVGVTDHLGIGLIAFCPLHQGLLTDKYINGDPDETTASFENSPLPREDLHSMIIFAVRELNQIANSREQTLAQMALSWVLRDTRITSTVVGASSPAQIEENCMAVDQTIFSTDEISRINSVLELVDMPPSQWASE